MSSKCKWCPVTIFWSKTETGFIPYEDEARTKVHDCPNKPGIQQQPAASEPQKALKVPPLTDREVLFLRKMVYFFEELQIK